MVKLLLLGTRESGKSTIAKQMKIIHLNGFSREELLYFKIVIATNVLEVMRTLIQQRVRFGYNLENESEVAEQTILAMPPQCEPKLTRELGTFINTLWYDPSIVLTFTRSSEYHLHDCAQYYMENISRLCQDNYLPTITDVLMSRVETTGILETVFSIQDIVFRLVDVGGLRSERRKWFHCFEGVTAILFCVALSEYDLKLYEDNHTNRMLESLQLFKEIIHNKWFPTTPVILFLNKQDLFREKITRVPLSTCFPQFTGANTFEDGATYIRDQFLGVNASGKSIYAHLTCATDTDGIAVVFNAVRDIILFRSIGSTGIM